MKQALTTNYNERRSNDDELIEQTQQSMQSENPNFSFQRVRLLFEDLLSELGSELGSELTFLTGKENGVNILKSIDEGPFQMGTFWETLAKELPNPRNQATVQDGRVIVQNVQGRQNRGQGNNARGAGAAGYGGAQNRVGNVNPGQARQVKCYNCNGIGRIERNCTQPKRPQNSEYFKDKMLLMWTRQLDEAPTAQTMFMANLSSVDPVYDEAGPSYDSDILSEVHDHDHYQDDACEHHEEHEMHDDVQPTYIVDSQANLRVIVINSYDQVVRTALVTGCHKVMYFYSKCCIHDAENLMDMHDTDAQLSLNKHNHRVDTTLHC
ncbi:hypothetical protein Tco_0798803 [Tanacetum coccineum]